LYGKLFGALAIFLVIFFGYRYVVNLQEANATLREEKQTLEISLQTITQEKENLVTRMEVSNEKLIELDTKLSKAREDVNRTLRLFSDHDFTNLVQRKPGLLEKLMQKATKKEFDEMEKIVNE